MDSLWSEFDIACMRRALELAERGRGQVSPNPPVGCVLVRGGQIIAEGWHDHLGDLHAEQAAIATANELAPIDLNELEITAILAFLETLSDADSLTGRLGVPSAVPSGLPVDQ